MAESSRGGLLRDVHSFPKGSILIVVSLSSMGLMTFFIQSPDHNILHFEISRYRARFEDVVSR